MITLLINQLTSSLYQYNPYKELKKRFRSSEFPINIEGVQNGFLPFILSLFYQESVYPALIVVPTEQEADALVQDLKLFPGIEGVLFPWWGTIPYGEGHPLPVVFGDRVRVLTRLMAGEKLSVVAPLRAFLTPLPDPQYLAAQIVSISVGDHLDHTRLALKLQAFGYLRVPRVTLKGEYAMRGEVVDIFPYGEDEALRIVLDFEQVAEIRQFNPITQSSTINRTGISISPIREVIITGVFIDRIKRNLLKHLHEELELNPELQGIEFLFPLCFNRSFSLLDYLPEDSVLYLIDSERLKSNSLLLKREYTELYKQASGIKRLRPAPGQILMDFSALINGFSKRVCFHFLKGRAGDPPRINMGSDPPRSFFGNISFFKEELENLIRVGYRVFIFAVYHHQAERLNHLLKELEVEIFPESISSGFSLPHFKIMVIQENEIFGRKKRIPRSVGASKTQVIDSFVELNPGDYVVHINYGIGLFNGIERIRAAGNERDYISIEYDGEERVYLPIEQLNFIQRHIGQEGKAPRLDRLGGRSWEARKKRVKRRVEDLARHLLILYSRRNTIKGFAFPKDPVPDSDWQSAFDAGFSYQETEDQLKCIEEVKQDMETPRPMDRLICGDVGYGKTEIALRAAFKAVMGGKQAAYLAPTTILVEQHFETFKERFEHFPVNIEMLSRFRSRPEQKLIVQGIARGEIDIVIGTHRLLQKDVKFRNLGLLIIDEEQRFGVKHKEKLKELKTSIDCLTLTATPIPRTLHMSLMKIRDMSIIDTPPQNRLPIETYIQEFDPEVIARAIRREIKRGGQVYYLHNRVQTMPRVHSYLENLLPGIRIGTAHGQMEEYELEEVMHRFIRGDFQVLLSTTIIENGLDIPNVNTIIINRADMFGISQLYQLRGRVGRADQAAYAYLLYPESRVISELAMKRLKIISDFTELGSGFKIALKDLEIRGAGNLLGREQHGDILSVGFDMYLKLLDEAIAEMSGEEEQEEAPDVYLELDYSGYIPDSYIAEPMEKMEVYKKIASITTDDELDSVHREIADRFGPLPDEVLSIFSIAETRILCKKLYISSLKEKAGTVTVEFFRLSELAVDRVLTLIKESGGSVYLDAKKPNCLLLKTGSVHLKDKSEFISERLGRLL